MTVWGEIPSQAIIQTLTGKVREILANPPRLDYAPVRPADKLPHVIWNKVLEQTRQVNGEKGCFATLATTSH